MADEQQSRNGRRQVWLGVAAALVVIVVLAVVSVTSGHSAAPATAPSAAPDPARGIQAGRLAAARRTPGDPLAMGSVTAPVVIVEWADFQCPFCAAFFTDTEPTLVEQYVKTGKARLEWRDFAFLGPESTLAAVAARAAARQDKFWQYHDVLYTEQHSENSGALTRDYLVGVAQRLGLDVNRFKADLADPTLTRQVAADQAQGSALGVNGTPAVLINGQLVDGAQPLATYQHDIDTALEHAAAAR